MVKPLTTSSWAGVRRGRGRGWLGRKEDLGQGITSINRQPTITRENLGSKRKQIKLRRIKNKSGSLKKKTVRYMYTYS